MTLCCAVWARPPLALTDLPVRLTALQVWCRLSHWLAVFLPVSHSLPVKCKWSSPLADRLVSWLWYRVPSWGPEQETGCGRMFTFDTPRVTDCCEILENTPQFSTRLCFWKLTRLKTNLAFHHNDRNLPPFVLTSWRVVITWKKNSSNICVHIFSPSTQHVSLTSWTTTCQSTKRL